MSESLHKNSKRRGLENFQVDGFVRVLRRWHTPDSMGTEASVLWTLPDRAPLLEHSFLFFIINHSSKQSVSLCSGNHSSKLWNPRRMKQPRKSSRKRGTRGYLVQAGKLKKAGLCSQRMQLIDSVQQLTGYIFWKSMYHGAKDKPPKSVGLNLAPSTPFRKGVNSAKLLHSCKPVFSPTKCRW